MAKWADELVGMMDGNADVFSETLTLRKVTTGAFDPHSQRAAETVAEFEVRGIPLAEIKSQLSAGGGEAQQTARAWTVPAEDVVPGVVASLEDLEEGWRVVDPSGRVLVIRSAERRVVSNAVRIVAVDSD